MERNQTHLRSFGCLCYPTVPKPHRDKFEPRTFPHVFIGYPFGVKGYKVLNLATKKICVSIDVFFHESIFPFSLPSMSNSSYSLPDIITHQDHSDILSTYPTHSPSPTPSPSHTTTSSIPVSPNHIIHSPPILNTTSPPAIPQSHQGLINSHLLY